MKSPIFERIEIKEQEVDKKYYKKLLEELANIIYNEIANSQNLNDDLSINCKERTGS